MAPLYCPEVGDRSGLCFCEEELLTVDCSGQSVELYIGKAVVSSCSSPAPKTSGCREPSLSKTYNQSPLVCTSYKQEQFSGGMEKG